MDLISKEKKDTFITICLRRTNAYRHCWKLKAALGSFMATFLFYPMESCDNVLGSAYVYLGMSFPTKPRESWFRLGNHNSMINGGTFSKKYKVAYFSIFPMIAFEKAAIGVIFW